jgi:hypothetical protein
MVLAIRGELPEELLKAEVLQATGQVVAPPAGGEEQVSEVE